MKQILFILLIITIYAIDLNAQSKPRRDISKDKSVILAKKKEAKKAAEIAKQKKRDAAKRYRKKKVIQTPKTASFLRVNQLQYINKTVSSNGGSETFEVNTDGKEWNVVALPLWCHLTKYANSFVLSYSQNPSHDERSDWFKVKSDNLEVKIDITQTGLPLNLSARFNYCSLQHDASHYNKGTYEKCLTIVSNVTIKGAKNQKCLIVAFFYDDAGNSIKATYKYPDYAIPSSKDVFVATEVVPTSDEAQTFNSVLYLPNDAMALLKKKNKIRCQLVVYCVKTSSYISNANYTMYFKAKKKRGKITTKKM